MAHSGPHLPSSHNEKRKRDNDLIITGDASDSSSAYGERSRTPDASAKRPRTIGPSLPPANSEERPSAGPENPSESGSDGDEFGPSLPPVGASAAQDSQQHQPKSAPSMGPQIPSKSQRDEWMIVPPSSDDWTARVDPTKLKSRKFNTGKGAKGPSGALSRGEDSKWTETPGERKARLEREVMGIADNASPRGAPRDDVKAAATAQKLREYNVSLGRPVSSVLMRS